MNATTRETLKSRGEVRDQNPRADVRSDIQGLRAVAVLVVVGFHFWPNLIPGGFIGVDVFFVISGYLITSHLLRNPPRTPRDIVDFWGRRVRRLLPASLLVIAVTLVVGCLVLPATQLVALGRDAVASIFYVENWNLASSSVNYLAAGAPPSPLQHYWSLGVEEQFYLIWPLLIAFLVWIATRQRISALVAATIGLCTFLAVSLAVSVVWTSIEPASAYFATPTRLWELAAGGVVASVEMMRRERGGFPGGPLVRAGSAWIGLIAIGAGLLFLNAQTPFPGSAALIPVVGAVLFIAADAGDLKWAPTVVLGLRPIQFVGDTSYGIYLWHYPLIILLTGAFARDLGVVDKAVIFVTCLILAQLTRRFVEDPVRRSSWLRTKTVRTFALAALATLVLVAVSFAPTAQVHALSVRANDQRQSIIASNSGCFGAQDLVTPGCSIRGKGLIPAPADAHLDVASAYADSCFAEKPFATVVTCQYGDPKTAKYRVALVGNSHAVQWLPALQELISSKHLLITTYVASGCMPSSAHVLFDTRMSSDGCRSWGERVVRATSSGNFDLVVTSVASNSDLIGIPSTEKFAPQAAGYTSTLASWAASKVPVLVIRDTPIPGYDIPDCIAQHLTAVGTCDGDRSKWLAPDPMIAAAKRVNSPFVHTVDLSDHFCSPTRCYAVIGGVIVYFDFLHVGATFIKTTATYLTPSIDSLLVH